jgi:SAM-dependent methyltransferase
MEKYQLETPVSFHIFNRPRVTQRVFNVIRMVKPRYLFVTADGPRKNVPQDAENCKAVRELVEKNIDWQCELYKNYSEVNKGSYKSTSGGITWVFQNVEEAIILEDDCLPSLSFFRFCRELLDYYQANTRIGMISGNNFLPGMQGYEYSYYFSIYTHMWGWATWKRTWDAINLDMIGWEQFRDKGGLKKIFSDEHAIRYWHNIFQSMYDKKRQHWDYKLLLSAFMNDTLTILPSLNLVSNIGAGKDATNCKFVTWRHNLPANNVVFPLKHPPHIERLRQADQFTEDNVFSGLFKKPNPSNMRQVKNLFVKQETVNKSPSSDVDKSGNRFYQIISQVVDNLNKNNNTEALILLEQAVAMNPNIPDINYGKAVALARLGRIDEAVNAIKNLLSAIPHHENAKKLLVFLEMPRSPLTDSSNVVLEKQIKCSFLIEIYNQFGIDVQKYFEGLDTVNIYKCCDTGYQFYHPFTIEGDGAFYESLQKFTWYYMDWKWEHEVSSNLIHPNDKILEIGCARGGFLESMYKKGIDCTGLELNKSAAEFARHKGLNVFEQTVQDHAQQHPEEYDAVCSFQVMEHIATVKDFIQAQIDVLKPGGKMILSVPNNDAFMFKCDDIQTLNRPPHHVGLWNTTSLISLTKIFNLRLDGIEFEPLQDYHVKYSQSLVMGKLVQQYQENGKKMIKDNAPIISAVAQLILKNVAGHTILAHYTKTDS